MVNIVQLYCAETCLKTIAFVMLNDNDLGLQAGFSVVQLITVTCIHAWQVMPDKLEITFFHVYTISLSTIKKLTGSDGG